jgi:hypothetical protein
MTERAWMPVDACNVCTNWDPLTRKNGAPAVGVCIARHILASAQATCHRFRPKVVELRRAVGEEAPREPKP